MEIDRPHGKSSILLYGLGVTGKSVINLFCQYGWKVCLYTDSPDQVKPEEFEKYSDNFRIISDLDLIDWGEIAFVIKAPVIKRDRPLLIEAESRGLEVMSDIEVAYRFFGGERIIAITGSNGKTTTTSLLNHILNRCGLKAYACGNIGFPVLDACSEASEGDWLVCECSSFQLASVSKFKPHIGAILNISPDHLDWHGTYDDYIACKLRLADNMDDKDLLLINGMDEILKKAYNEGALAPNTRIADFDGVLMDRMKEPGFLKLFGDHNRQNAIFAYEMARFIGLKEDEIIAAIKEFKSPAHRLEYVGNLGQVDFINDSKATNVDSAVKAIEALEGPLILIAGGYDKEVDLGPFCQAFKGKGKFMVLMGATAEKISGQMSELGMGDRVRLVEDMSEAVKLAFDLADPGDQIVLSPACASWGMYNNFEERGDDFKKAFQSLKLSGPKA